MSGTCIDNCCVVKIADIDTKQSMINAPIDTNAVESLSRLGQQLCGGSETAVRQLLVFGRYLHQLSLRLVTEQSSHTDLHRQMLRVSCLEFSAVHIALFVNRTSSHPCLGG